MEATHPADGPVRPARHAHVPALDGLRGLAILLVIGTHLSEHVVCHRRWLTRIRDVFFGGWTGVDLFFVLSGFLITGILWETRGSPHYLRNFYARRAFRIVPLNYAALIGLLILLPLASPLIRRLPYPFSVSVGNLSVSLGKANPYWPYFYFYCVDVLTAAHGLGIAMTHLWSLSVEEHFYLVWPFLVRSGTRRTLIFVSLGLVAAAFFIRLVATGVIDEGAIYTATPCRMDGLALGALLALLWRLPEHRRKLRSGALAVLPVTGAVLLTIFLREGFKSQYGYFPQTCGYSASILFYGSLLVIALEWQPVGAVFCHAFFRFFGKYSYSIYLFHVVLISVGTPFFALGNGAHDSILLSALYRLSGGHVFRMNRFLLLADGALYVLCILGSSIVVAMVTWRIIEAPCLRLKRYFEYEKKGVPVDGADIILARLSTWNGSPYSYLHRGDD